MTRMARWLAELMSRPNIPTSYLSTPLFHFSPEPAAKQETKKQQTKQLPLN